MSDSKENKTDSGNEPPADRTSETDPVPIPSSSGRRERSISESEPSSSEAGTGETPKRSKTAMNSSFPFVSASPPGFVTLEEIMKAANSVSNMTLAHEIAVDVDFHLKKLEPPSNSLQKIVKDIAHQAFWDLLKEELESDPPDYRRALTLLEEIKEWLLSLLLPHQTKTQQEIKDKIDIDLIRQQVESGTLDMQQYSNYIVSLMARLCSPGRDEKIRELTTLRDIIPLYKGIFQTLELMRLDMANFTIRQIRPQIAACSVEYERQKFDDYLKITPDGLRNTREWLYRNKKPCGSESATSSTDSVSVISTLLIDSFMELLKWDHQNPWPESLALDEVRFTELRHKLYWVEILSSVLLVSLSQDMGSALELSSEFRQSFKEHLAVVLGHPKCDEEMESLLPCVAAQVIEDIDKELKKQTLPQLNTEVKSLITGQVCALNQPDNRVRKIIHTRIMEFLRQVISNEVARPTQIPAGLSLFRSEIAGIAGQFARLVSHNRAVFAQRYADLIMQHCL